jgi:DNA-binding MarR family transcriptional regulator
MVKTETGLLLREVARLHLQIQRETVACCEGTTLTQCTILTELGRNGSCTLIELARKIGFDKSWTSRAVEALVQDGLVEKKDSPTDRRAIIISLSFAGQTRYEQLNLSLNNQAAQVLNSISLEEQAGVHKALELLYAALQSQAKNLKDNTGSSCLAL